MLVLQRKPGQSVVVGDEVVITVLEVHRHRVRLGIQAPGEIPVHRTELRDPRRWRGQECAATAAQ